MPSNEHPAPMGTEPEAQKNGSKGVRQHRRPLENFQELLEVDPSAALDSVRERKPSDPQITWTEMCDLWSKPKAARCAASTQKIRVGTDAAGCVHVLGPSYKDLYAVSERELKDGTKQEFCTVSVGPQGSTEGIEVIISGEESGPVYKKMRRVLIEAHNLSRNAQKFVADCEDAETLERHWIPPV